MDDVVNDLFMGPPVTTSVGVSATSQKQKKVRKRKKQEINPTRSKRKKTKHNANEGNVSGCGTPENTFSPQASTPALDMLSEHPVQCSSSGPITSQSCMEVGVCERHHEEEEQNVINPTTENSNAQHGVQEVSCNHISVAASPEPFAKDYVSEDVKLNTEHGYPSPENCSKEPTIQDHHKVESHKSSDGPSRISLMDGGTKRSIDQVTSQSGAAAQEIKFSADNNEQRFMTISSVADIPAEHLEPDGRRLDHTEITRNDLVCSGEEIELHTDNINEQRFMPTSSAVDIPVEQLEANGRQLDHVEITRNGQCCAAKEIELDTDNINEQKFMTKSAVDIPVEQLKTNGRQLDHAEIAINDQCCAGVVSDISFDAVGDGHLKTSQFSLDRSIAGNPKNKLLILDVNGLLTDFVSVPRYKELKPDFVVRGKKVYKRPFCDDFLQFCFDRFHVGVWSSRAKSNVDEAIKFLLGKSATKLLFCWNQSQCTRTKFTTVENINKPLVLKELRKLWEKAEPDLPWERGEFNESNTLLLDDSPYKALMNPMHSAIFPFSYRYFHTTDSELGPGGDLRVYLEGLATAENVQKYVSENPFGQRPIRESNPSWRYYRRVIEDVKRCQMRGDLITVVGDNCIQNNA